MVRCDSMMAIGAIASDVPPREAGVAMPNLTGRPCSHCECGSIRIALPHHYVGPHAVIGNSWLLFRARQTA
jgi:hypothetical protein